MWVKHALRIPYRLFVKRPNVMWIGDSHASFISSGGLVPPWTLSPEGDLVFWLGPVLAFNFRANQLRTSWTVLLRKSSVTEGVFVFGEIDVRVHLGEDRNKRSTGWVDRYLGEVAATTRRMRLDRVVVLGPVPPSRVTSRSMQGDPAFVARGTLGERVAATAWLREALKHQCHQRGFDFLALDDVVAAPDGCLRPEYDLDGCHLNAEGSRLVRESVRARLR
jgi:hypothetical protein